MPVRAEPGQDKGSKPDMRISTIRPIFITTTWNGTSGNFDDPSAWTPVGIPQSGDTLIVANGNPVATGQTLSGYTIDLGGTVDTPGPGVTVNYEYGTADGAFGLSSSQAPDPTLSLINSTIGSNTMVLVPDTGRHGTLLITGGTSENYGTIGTAGSGDTLYLSIFAASLENRGTISAAEDSSIIMSGVAGSGPAFPYPATMHNDGIINVDGFVKDSTVNLEGDGTVILGSTPSLLGLSPTPGSFEYDQGYETIASTQDFVFQGGKLDLHASNFTDVGGGRNFNLSSFQAMLSDFGHNSADLITLDDFNVSTQTFADGILSLTGINEFGAAQGVSLRFANLPTRGGFAFSESNNVADITWRT
jgi:hypothetical protein